MLPGKPTRETVWLEPDTTSPARSWHQLEAGHAAAGPREQAEPKGEGLALALDRLTGGAIERPDSPDAWVTAVRRLPARAAQIGPAPTGLEPRLVAVLRERGIEQFYA